MQISLRIVSKLDDRFIHPRQNKVTHGPSLEAVGIVGAGGGADSGGVLPDGRGAGVGQDAGVLVAVGVVGAGGGAHAGGPLRGGGSHEGEGEENLPNEDNVKVSSFHLISFYSDVTMTLLGNGKKVAISYLSQ